MNTTTIAAVTIGQSPRDDVVPELKALMLRAAGPAPGNALAFIEMGALDGLGDAEIAKLAPGPDDNVLVSRLRNGRQVRLSEERVKPLVQDCVTRVSERAQVVLLLCTGPLGRMTSSRPFLVPDRILAAVALSVVGDGHLGVLTPDTGQASWQSAKWTEAARRAGLATTVSVAAASPYTSRVPEWTGAAEALSRCDVIVMDCMGYTLAMKEMFGAVSGRPVFLARSVLARVACELIGDGHAAS